MTKAKYVRYLVIAAGFTLSAVRIEAQDTRADGGISSIAPGSELDEYLRYLQTTGAVRTGSWSIRELSIRQTLARIPVRANPWESRL